MQAAGMLIDRCSGSTGLWTHKKNRSFSIAGRDLILNSLQAGMQKVHETSLKTSIEIT